MTKPCKDNSGEGFKRFTGVHDVNFSVRIGAAFEFPDIPIGANQLNLLNS